MAANRASTTGIKRDPRGNVAQAQVSTEERAASPGRSRKRWKDSNKSILKVFGIKEDPNYVYRVANDDPLTGRLFELKERGYEHVAIAGIQVGDTDANSASNVGNVVSKVVGADRQGNPLRAYLLRIRKEYYEEDARDKAEAVAAQEASISKGWENQEDGNYSKHESHTLVGRGTKAGADDEGK